VLQCVPQNTLYPAIPCTVEKALDHAISPARCSLARRRVNRLPSRRRNEGWSLLVNFLLLPSYFLLSWVLDVMHANAPYTVIQRATHGTQCPNRLKLSRALPWDTTFGVRSRILSVNDPLQRSRLKIQFAFCLGVRYASHLSPVVNRIRTTIPFQSILN